MTDTRTPAPASDDAMEVWQQANRSAWRDPASDMDNQAAARIIQQYGDRREAAGFRRGVEAAAKVADGFYDNSMKMLPPMQQKIAAKILALPETQEAG